MESDMKVPEDRGEPISLMEPLLVGEDSRFRNRLTDLALDLAQKAAGFRRSLPESLLTSLADLVRALKNDYATDVRKRDLQIEAKAHITVQKWIDGGGLKGRAVTTDNVCEIHRRFGELLPENLLWVEDPVTSW